MRCSCSQDTPTVPRQIASLAILEPDEHAARLRPADPGHQRAPRHRAALPPGARKVPGALGTPVWVDDENFDISLHVRRSALPTPGHDRRAARARRPAHRAPPRPRPAAVGALPDRGARRAARVALLFKAHQALVDGSETVDLAQVLLEETAHDRDIPHEEWNPRPEPHAARAGARTRSTATSGAPARRCAITEHQRRPRWLRKLPLIGGPTRRHRARAVDRAVAAPPVRVARDRPRRLPHGCARSTAAPSTTSSSRRSPAASAAGC